MKKIIIWIAVICLISVVVWYFFGRNVTKTVAWRTAPVEKGKIEVIVTATGSVNPDTTVSVGTQVSGIISKLYVDWNSVVKEGQLIATIDTTFLQATKEDAEATMEKAQFQLNEMKREYSRGKKLYDSSVTARSDYDLALTNLQTATSAVKSAEAQLRRAKINLQYAKITAPISGKVISRNVDVGQTVIASFNTPTLFTIANNLKKMQVMANVDEADIGQVKTGQRATFTVDAFPDMLFEGLVKQIRLQPNIIQNVVNYTVIIDAPNPDLKLMPGLTANIHILVKEHDDVLKVPSNAFHFIAPPEFYENNKIVKDSVKEMWRNARTDNTVEGKKVFIWLQDSTGLVPHAVTVGLTDGSFTEITGDVREHEQVVLGISKDQDKQAKTINPFMPTFPKGTRKTVR